MSFYEDASWLLIPSGIKEDVVFAQKPTSGLGDLTFTRASDATYTDSTGVVRRSPYNLVQQSEMFSNVYWSKAATTIGIDATLAPNGTLTADALIGNGVSGTHYVSSTAYNVVAGVSYSISIYAKKNTNNFIQLDVSGLAFGGSAYANFDLNNGIVGTVGAGITASIQSVGDGWYRCVISRASLSTTAAPLYIALITNSNSTAFETNTLSTSVFIWGAQVNEGTSALDYFPTTDRLNVPRIDFRNADGTLSSCGRLLLEPQRTNSIRNSSMVGAVAGTPGTLPTNWSVTSSGLTRTIVGIGTELGLPYIDIRLNGTANAVFAEIYFDAIISASAAQSWTNVFFSKIITTPTAPNSYILATVVRGSSITIPIQAFTPTSNLSRFAQTITTPTGATSVQPLISFGLTVGATYDFTIRIAAPQMELGAYATTWVPTTTAAVTRLGDAFTRSNIYTNGLITAAGGTWFVDLSNNLSYTRDSSAASINIGDGAANGLYFAVLSTGRLQLRKRVSNVETILYTTLTDNIKVAIKWNGATADFFVNGAKVVSATAFTTTVMNTFSGSAIDVPKYINQMLLAPTPLSDAECIQLTTL